MHSPDTKRPIFRTECTHPRMRKSVDDDPKDPPAAGTAAVRMPGAGVAGRGCLGSLSGRGVPGAGGGEPAARLGGGDSHRGDQRGPDRRQSTREPRVERLRAFWERVSTPILPSMPEPAHDLFAGDIARGLLNQVNAAGALLRGAPGFFAPRMMAPRAADRGRTRLGIPEEARRARRCGSRSTPWSARSITARCGWRRPPWATSTGTRTWMRCGPPWRRRISCSRSSRTWTAARGSRVVEYRLEEVTLKGAWTSPAALSLMPHALAPVAELPVLEVVSAVHLVCDLTLGLGKVVHDYLR